VAVLVRGQQREQAGVEPQYRLQPRQQRASARSASVPPSAAMPVTSYRIWALSGGR
jgi:hypothetical protein